MRTPSRLLATFFLLACALHCAAQQERGLWQASSNTAKNITGDIAFSETKVAIDFMTFSIASIRTLKPEEVAAVFDADVNTAGSGALYRLNIPAAQRFLHKNALCGTESTQWMATYIAGRTLRVAFFSGQAAPEFTFDAISHSTNLCGTYTYAR